MPELRSRQELPAFVNENKEPPRFRSPEMESFGLEVLKQYMDKDAWETFIAVVSWSIHWQDVFDGKSMSLQETDIGLISAPFVGMGSPNVWPIYQQTVSTLFITTMLTWWSLSNEEKKQKSLVWSIIDVLGPVMANVSKGYQDSLSLRAAIKDPDLKVPFR